MKIIDLLNKIAKGEAPETIFYMGSTYDYDKECMDYEDVDTGDLFFDDRYNTQILNDEIEIIEEKPKKITTINLCKQEDAYFIDVLNDTIKAVNYLLEKESDK